MKSIMELTHTAKDHAVRHALLSLLEKVQLDPWVVAGDIIAVGEEPHGHFRVHERRIMIDEEGAVAAVTFKLDYPAYRPR